MKIRSGFVSNSSSSSFIIGYDLHSCPKCGRSNDLINMLERDSSGWCDTGIREIGYDSIIEAINGLWRDDTESIIKPISDFHLSNPAALLVYCTVDYNDIVINELINTSKDVTILFKEEA